MSRFDLFVIGAGSGGVRTARMAASLGARVAIAEDRYMGGTCVNVGCVPKKLYSMAAHFSHDFEDAAGFGWSLGPRRFDWDTLRDNKSREILRLNGIYQGMLEKAGCTVIQGRARIKGPHTVAVGDTEYDCERILIATGGWPYVPAFPGREHVLTSNEIFDLPRFPESIVIVGAGYIAVEFAGIFAGLGSDVTLVYRGQQVLRGFDHEVREHFQEALGQRVRLRLEDDITEVDKVGPDHYRLALSSGDTLEADAVLFATGRRPHLEGLGLEQTQVKLTDQGTVSVNEHFQTNEASIYALGDVVGRLELTPVALAEGTLLARHLFAGEDISLSYENIPTAVFSDPAIATVGLSEAQARERFPEEIQIFKTRFRHMKHTLSGREERTFMKVVVHRSDDRVLGIHMVGEEAAEIMQGFAVAMTCGLTKAQLDATIGIHPSAAEELVTLRTASD